MFKASVTASEFRDKVKSVLEMVTEDQAVQILHRGNPIKVLVTQQHYLELVQKAAVCDRLIDASGDIPVSVERKKKVTTAEAMQMLKERSAATRARLETEPHEL